jgi:hypothetical protein
MSTLQGTVFIQLVDIEISRKRVETRFTRLYFSFLHIKTLSLSTMRVPLGETSPNIVRGKELAPKLRGKILGMHKSGHSIPYIIERLKQS